MRIPAVEAPHQVESEWKRATSKAWRWVVENLPHFDPFAGGSFDSRRNRPLGELAIMLYVYARSTGDREGPQAQAVSQLLKSLQERPEFIERVLQRPDELGLSCHVYAALLAVGRGDEAHLEVLHRAIDGGLPSYAPPIPEVVMDLEMSMEWAGLSTGQTLRTDPGSAPALSSTDPLHLSDSLIYALTHTVLFATCFGTRDGQPFPASVRIRLRQTLAALVVALARAQSYDLLGEILACWDCLKLSRAQIYWRGCSTFLAQQNPDGSFPNRAELDPTGGRLDQRFGSKAQPDLRNFFERYHTTLVCLLAGCIAAAVGKEDHGSIADLPAKSSPAPHAGLSSTSVHHELAICKARDWLVGVLAATSREAEPRLEFLLQALLGCWICDSTISGEVSTTAVAAEAVQAHLSRRSSATIQSLTGLSSFLKICSYRIMSSSGFDVPVLADYVSTAADALRACPVDDPVADLAFVEKRVLLHQIGRHPEPKGLPLVEMMRYADGLGPGPSYSQIEELVLRSRSVTACGTRRVEIPQSELGQWLMDLLRGLAVSAFRVNDLQLGCKLVRTMTHLGLPSSDTRSFLDYITLQQGQDGAFGLAGTTKGPAPTNPEGRQAREERLPLTIQILWTLAETAPGNWRLYQSLSPASG